MATAEELRKLTRDYYDKHNELLYEFCEYWIEFAKKDLPDKMREKASNGLYYLTESYDINQDYNWEYALHKSDLCIYKEKINKKISEELERYFKGCFVGASIVNVSDKYYILFSVSWNK